MAHGLNSVLKRGATAVGCKSEGKTGIGSRRIFAPHFKLQVLDSYRNDADCKGNQRATARKYGIHRRQIQKWLQVEGNLRNSVVKRAEGEPRPRDDESRVPALSPAAPAPLDFTTRSRGSPPAPAADPAAPMDLSLKRPAPMAAGAVNAPATYCPPSPLRVPSPPSLAQPHPDVWDLSTKRKCEDPTPITHSPTSSGCSPKPVKLFKPYLDDVFDTPPPDKKISSSSTSSSPPPCCSTVLSNTCEAYYYNNNNTNINNNNNNICDIKSEYSTTYTLHELQPKTSLNYYYTFPSTYHTQEYEMNPFCANYDDPNYVHSSVVPLKQRHSYSLDFKLSAIECYYQDSVCKGNQRAVATKYNIHRRQVQKWLKQADELRQKNETIKQTTQTVR